MLSGDLIQKRYKEIQDHICISLEAIDGKSTFKEDVWTRLEGGGGRTRIISGGRVIEKGGVNFSCVYGKLPEVLRKEYKLDGDFLATGVSIVLHPVNPWVPIIHMNIRYFEFSDGRNWFGGGIDLTPHYVRKDQAVIFHKHLKKICDHHDSNFYSEYSKWADEYFFIKHRDETRGVGGIFYDQRIPANEKEKQKFFDLSVELGISFPEIYSTQVGLNQEQPYGEKEKQWQLLRRGRYVEFNLIYDRGTKFGLQTGGRIESILMSLPENASWLYDHQPEKGSLEDQTLEILRNPKPWI